MSDMEARSLRSFQSIARCASLPNLGPRPRPRPRPRCGREQDGAVAVVFAVVVVGMLGMCGLAMDAALVYNRKVEMQSVADAAALGAARKLNGTASGITDAVSAAATAATSLKYQYSHKTMTWSDSAIRFSTTPDRDGTWVDAGTAAALAARIYYVRVDTSQLDGVGDVQTLLMPVLSSAMATVTASSEAIAGRITIAAAPLAICAMSTDPAAARTNSASYIELVEYGFRRGVSYDLMNLTPDGTTPANFVINPLATPGTAGLASDLLPATVGPYTCTGTLGIARLAGDTIAVGQPFPIGSLFKQLNSRFDQYDDDLCNFHGAPPDTNIKSYVSTAMPATFPWMNIAPTAQSAVCNGDGDTQLLCSAPSGVERLMTVADLPPPPSGPAIPGAQYGPVWAYARAVPFSAYALGVPEPYPNGYSTFTTASWSALYGGQTARTYPTGSTATPYKAATGVNFAAPSTAHKPGAKGRRVLNVPLLSCSTMPGSSATVLAIGRFFMTVPATATSVAAEFAGAVPLQQVEGTVGLFP